MKQLILITLLFFFYNAHAQNVGVGTSSPVARLHIVGNNDTIQLRITANAIQSNLNPFIKMEKASGQELARIHSDHIANIFMGRNAGKVNVATDTTGICNTFVGAGAGAFNTIGYGNTAIGYWALYKNTTGKINTAVGDFSLNNNTSGAGNTGIGLSTLFANTTGYSNTALGSNTLYNNTSASMNIAIGESALRLQSFNNSGTAWNTENVAIGVNALHDNQPTSDINGNKNTALGNLALTLNTTGSNNTAQGYRALLANTTGTFNSAFGSGADVTSGGLTNATAIGYNAKVSSSNSLILGGTGASAVNVGIGTTTPHPTALLHVDLGASTSKGLLVTGNLNGSATIPNLGAGTRMMFYPGKAAFRAGYIDGTQWDDTNVGQLSFAMGYNTIASGDGSYAFGNSATSSGTYSIAWGDHTSATGTNSIAMGGQTIASGGYSTSIGLNTFSKAFGSFTAGMNNDNTDNPPTVGTDPSDRIFQVGNGDGITHTNAVTILRNGNTGIGTVNPGFILDLNNRMRIRSGGDATTSAGLWLNKTDNSALQAFIGIENDTYASIYSPATGTFPFGMNTNNGDIKIMGRLGIGTTNPTVPLSFPLGTGEKILLYPGAIGTVGIGVYGNELRIHSDNPGSKVSFGTQTTAGVFTELGKFEANGAYAMSVFGSIWVNGTTYSSDERFKKNITPISAPLEKLLQIKGVEYEMNTAAFPKNNFPGGRQIGFLAQNVEKVIPEAVSEKDGYKGVDYARLVPLLVESIREQQQEIDELKALIKNSR